MSYGHRGTGVEIYEPVVVIRPEKVQLRDHCRIDSFVKIEGGEGVDVGEYVHVASFCHINVGGGRVEIGPYAALASGAKIIGGSNLIDGRSMSASAPAKMQVVERKYTVLGPYAFLATNAVLLPGVFVGEGAVIAAGAVVTKDVPPWEIWGGIPAKKIGTRVPRV